MKNKTKFSFLGFLILFLTISVAVTISILVCTFLLNKIVDNYWIIALVMFGVILILTFICTLIDLVRRKKTVDDPTEQILQATQKILMVILISNLNQIILMKNLITMIKSKII